MSEKINQLAYAVADKIDDLISEHNKESCWHKNTYAVTHELSDAIAKLITEAIEQAKSSN